GELVRGLVGVVDGPVDAVAEAEVLGEPEGRVPEGRTVPVRADLLDQRAVVLGGEDGLDRLLDAESAAAIRYLHGDKVTPGACGRTRVGEAARAPAPGKPGRQGRPGPSGPAARPARLLLGAGDLRTHTGRPHLPQHERVVERDLAEAVVATRGAAVAGGHVGHEEERVVVGLVRPELRAPLRR